MPCVDGSELARRIFTSKSRPDRKVFGSATLATQGGGQRRTDAGILIEPLCSTQPLLLDFDDVPPYCFVCFVTLGLEVRPSLRLVKCLCVAPGCPTRLIATLLGAAAPSMCSTRPAAVRKARPWARLYRRPGDRKISLLRIHIRHVKFADTVGFELGLGVQPLRGRCAERGAQR